MVGAPRRQRPDLGEGDAERAFLPREVTGLRLKESVDSKQRSIIYFTMYFTNFAHFRMKKRYYILYKLDNTRAPERNASISLNALLKLSFFSKLFLH